METITLNGKKELDIYMNPQRQRLLRILTLSDEPLNPKQLSDRLGISPSSVQHHIKLLVELGVAKESHTRQIRGITAHYYRAVPVTVRIGCLVGDDNAAQRLAIIQNGVSGVFNGLSEYLNRNAGAQTAAEPMGDVLWGVARLQPEEALELFDLIHAYLNAHEPAVACGDPWEYALMAYPVQVENHA
jgi:DNA-binding transcriptional ArsR family regulator